MKAARALASHLQLVGALTEGSPRAAWFLARVQITPAQFRGGMPAPEAA